MSIFILASSTDAGQGGQEETRTAKTVHTAQSYKWLMSVVVALKGSKTYFAHVLIRFDGLPRKEGWRRTHAPLAESPYHTKVGLRVAIRLVLRVGVTVVRAADGHGAICERMSRVVAV